MLEETEKTHIPKKLQKVFLGFSKLFRQFIPNYSTLNYTHTSVKRTNTKGS